MLESLQDKFQSALKTLKGEAKIRPSHIEEALQEIRKSLLEADVSFPVVKRFLQRVQDQALGSKVVGSLTPYQQFLYVLQSEMQAVFGDPLDFNLQAKPPVVILMVGLQGSGKTTSSGKLAHFIKRKLKKKPLLVSVDVRRPAAIEQLERLAKDAKVDYLNPQTKDPSARAKQAVEYAKTYGIDVLIVDTAGRLSIDDELMSELQDLHRELEPNYVFYVADAMSGQQGLQVAEGFSKRVGLNGAIVTKADADARGGVALSIREALAVPLAFVGSGEKLEDFESFHADRWVSRVLGMGDLKSLVEKVEEASQEAKSAGKKPESMAKRALKGKLSLVDFQDQMKMVSKMGSLKSIMGMIPGMGQMAGKVDTEALEGRLKRIDAMINSMTPTERAHPDMINGSRKRRISSGSGTSVEELNQFLTEFWQMQKMMKNFKGMRGMGKLFG